MSIVGPGFDPGPAIPKTVFDFTEVVLHGASTLWPHLCTLMVTGHGC